MTEEEKQNSTAKGKLTANRTTAQQWIKGLVDCKINNTKTQHSNSARLVDCKKEKETAQQQSKGLADYKQNHSTAMEQRTS